MNRRLPESEADPKAASYTPRPPAFPVATVLTCERRARELKGGLLYILYLCNQRDMLMLFFSFSVSRILRLGWEGEGDRGKEVQSSAPFGSLANYMIFPLILPGWIQTGGVNSLPTPPLPAQVDLNIVRAKSVELIFAFSWISQGPNFWDWELVLETGVL